MSDRDQSQVLDAVVRLSVGIFYLEYACLQVARTVNDLDGGETEGEFHVLVSWLYNSSEVKCEIFSEDFV